MHGIKPTPDPAMPWLIEAKQVITIGARGCKMLWLGFTGLGVPYSLGQLE